MTFQRTFNYPPMEEASKLLGTVNSAPWRGLGPHHWLVTSVRFQRQRGGWVMLTEVSPARRLTFDVHSLEGFQRFAIYEELDFRKVAFGRKLRRNA